MKNLLTALYSKLSGSTFSTDVGGRIYLDQAPPNTEFPYCVFFVVSDTPEDVFVKDGESVLIQFDLFSSSSGATELATMYADLKSLLDDCAMTITSNTLVWCRRVGMQSMTEDDITTEAGTQTVKHYAVDYELTTQVS